MRMANFSCDTAVINWNLEKECLNRTVEQNGRLIEPEVLEVSHVEIVIETCALALMSVVGVVSNFWVIVTACYSKKLRRKTHLLVLNLAVVDFLICLIFIPVYMHSIIMTRWMLGSDSCIFIWVLLQQNLAVSVLSNTAIAANRYFNATLRNGPRRILCGTKVIIIGIVGIWIAAFTCSILPVLSGYIQMRYCPYYAICGPSKTLTPPRQWFVCYLILYTIGFFLPVLVTATCYYKVFQVVRNQINFTKSARARERYIRSSKRMVLMFVVFCLCWLPDTVHFGVDPESRAVPVYVTRFLFFLLLFNSAINPFLYAWKFETFRTTLRTILRHKRNEKEKPKIPKPMMTIIGT